jgi:hypothetical protein
MEGVTGAALLHAWGAAHDRQPSELGARVTYLTTGPVTPQSVPEYDWAVPLR